MTKALLHNLGSSLSFGRLSLKAKVLWPMLLAASDDQGRGIAEADAVKWYLCPNVPEITVDDVPGLLGEMVAMHMIMLYPAGDVCQVYQVVRWWEYQQLRWARPSRFDPPDGWTDRIRYSNRGEMYKNDGWETTGGFDAMTEADAKLISGQSPDHDTPENCTENSTENNADFQPNLTQPNSTQPNLTPSLQAEDAPPAPETRTITPGPEPQKPAPTLTPQEVDAYLATPDPALLAQWPTLRLEMQGQVTRDMYDQWIAPLQPLVMRDHTAFFCHPTTFGQEWCTSRLKVMIDRTVRSIVPDSMGAAVLVGGTP